MKFNLEYPLKISIFLVFMPSLSVLLLSFTSSTSLGIDSSSQDQTIQTGIANKSNCISYDASAKIITIACGSASLTDINNQLKDSSILQKGNNGEWLLNAGIKVAENAALYINSSDTSWLKISADGVTAHSHTYIWKLKD